jgi:hypothetical protein
VLPTSSGGGVTWPLLWPMGFAAGAGNGTGQLVLQNRGNVDAPLQLRIDGPVVNPAVYHQETGKLLTLQITVAVGDYLLIDTEARTVLLNGTASRRSAVVQGSTWPAMVPGTNTLRITGTQGVSPTVNFAANPDASGITGTTVVRTNLFQNPIFWLNGNFAAAAPGTGGTAAGARQSAQSGWGYGVTTSFRTTWSVATSAVSGGFSFGFMPGIVGTGGFVPYSMAMQVRCSKVQRVRPRIDWYTAGSVFISSTNGPDTVLAANTVTDLQVTAALAPATATQAIGVVEAVVGTSGTTWAVGNWLEFTAVHLEQTNQPLVINAGGVPFTGTFWGDFAPGSYSQPETTFAWTGTAHGSTSTMSLPGVTGYSGTGSGAGAGKAGIITLGGSGATVVAGQKSPPDAPVPGLTKAMVTFAANGGNSALVGIVNGLAPSTQYTWSAYLWLPAGCTYTFIYITASSGSTFWDSPALNASTQTGAWYRLSTVATTDATGALACYAVVIPDGNKGTDRVYATGFLLEQGTALNSYSDTTHPRYVPQLVATARSAWL